MMVKHYGANAVEVDGVLVSYETPVLDYTQGKIFANFGVYAPSVGIGLGACSRVQANAILANCVVNEIFGGRVNGGAVWFDTIKQMP